MTERLLVLAPTARDAELSGRILSEAGLTCHHCTNLGHLCRELDAGAGAVLLTDAMLGEAEVGQLAAALSGQPPWSDIPVILLSPRGADSPTASQAMDTLGNVTVLEQPIRVITLVSALRSALKARLRQYELRDRLEALRASDRQKDEFLATLSHELRNPLAPIRNALHVLRLAGADQNTRVSVMDTMERQMGNVIRLVDDLLEVSRINQGRIDLRKERVKLSDILRSALESSGPLIEAAGHELIFAESAETVLLEADPVRLIQLFANLLNNAAKYTEPGGKIWLTVRREGRNAIVSVRDTGMGIPAEMLPRVFDLFVQVDTTGDRSRPGMGIGLTLVKRLVELHGGRVEAFSAGRGQGSEFVVRLPALADQRKPGKARTKRRSAGPDRRKSASATCRILVVDDHHDAADSLATLLRLLGHEVRLAYDGPAGIDAAGAFRPDVVLLDIGLPGMDGHEVAKRLRKLKGFDRVLLVALTGYGRDEDRRRSREAGFDSHLIKPVDLTALNALLAEHRGSGSGPPRSPSRRREPGPTPP